MELNTYSDYGSGSSMNSDFQEFESCLPLATRAVERPRRRASSYVDLVLGRCTLEDVMKEFQMNGSDAPYNPDGLWTSKTDDSLGVGSSIAYLRQSSWPAPELTPAQILPRPHPSPSAPTFSVVPTLIPTITPKTVPTAAAEWSADFLSFAQNISSTSTPTNAVIPPTTSLLDNLTEEQKRVLTSLPNDIIYTLLRQIKLARNEVVRHSKKPEECRFCKSNGERECYYRSHSLKDAEGRVQCPVLRAFVCRRCGARGDSAHTAKYCPMATNEERLMSPTMMMRGARLASGRRRTGGAGGAGVVWEAHPDPRWAALEEKLLL